MLLPPAPITGPTALLGISPSKAMLTLGYLASHQRKTIVIMLIEHGLTIKILNNTTTQEQLAEQDNLEVHIHV